MFVDLALLLGVVTVHLPYRTFPPGFMSWEMLSMYSSALLVWHDNVTSSASRPIGTQREPASSEVGLCSCAHV
jgi:hypothetical protein